MYMYSFCGKEKEKEKKRKRKRKRIIIIIRNGAKTISLPNLGDLITSLFGSGPSKSPKHSENTSTDIIIDESFERPGRMFF
jgi:hypothetical protein